MNDVIVVVEKNSKNVVADKVTKTYKKGKWTISKTRLAQIQNTAMVINNLTRTF